MILFFISPLLVSAQTFTLSGTLVDSTDHKALPEAHVFLSRRDTLKAAVVSDDSGGFRLEKLQNGFYKLKVTYLGFKTLEKLIRIEGKDIDLGKLAMLAESTNLQEVDINAHIPAAEQNGDTTQFNAQAFKVNQEASAEDLIQKMPGMVLKDGKMQAQGEDVKKVLLDGREFFGEDPNAALKNLPAEVIDKIQVFDQKSEQAQFSGFDDGQTTKTLNIITRGNMRNSQFGKVYAGYGYDNKYQAGGNINIFKGDSRISIIGQSNNVNVQNFSSSDLLGMMSSNSHSGHGGRPGGRGGRPPAGPSGGPPQGGRFNTGGDISNFMIGQQSGISTTNALGVNYSDKWGKKINVSGSYFFNMNKNNANDSLFRQYILPGDSGQFYREINLSSATNINHRISFRMDYKIDSLNSLTFRPRMTLQQYDGNASIDGQTLSGTELLNSTLSDKKSNLLAYTFSGDLLYRHSFRKKGRTLSSSISMNTNNNSGNNKQFSENQYYSLSTPDETINQKSDLNRKGWTGSANLMYTEPVSDKDQLMFSYRASYRKDNSDQETHDYDSLTNAYTIPDTLLSNTFKSNYVTQQAGAGYNHRAEKTVFMLRATYQNATLANMQIYPVAATGSKSFNNFLPFAMFRYSISRNKNLRIFYRTNSNAPSIQQLQDVVDNSNPLQISIGNPYLKQSYDQNLFLRYSAANPEKSTSFFVMAGGGISSDYITNASLYALRDTIVKGVQVPAGVQLIQPINLDGYYNFRTFATYGLPLKFIRSNLNLNAGVNFSRTPGSVNGRINYSSSSSFEAGLAISSNISEKLDFMLYLNSNYSLARNSLQTSLNSDYFSQESRFRFNWIFWKGFLIQTELNHTYNSGLSAGYNQNYLLWNLALGKKLFKERGELKLFVYDLLDQNKSITRTVSDSYIEDSRTEVLQRYFMLSFTYSIKNIRK